MLAALADRDIRRVIFASVAGATIEWYERLIPLTPAKP